MRKIKVNLNDIFDLVVSSEDYGFNDSVLMEAFANWVGEITNSDIEAFTQRYLTESAKMLGYSEEDAANAKECLEEWGKQYKIYE